MKHFLLLFLMLTAFFPTLNGFAIEIKYLESSPVIDGKLENNFWSHAGKSHFKNINGLVLKNKTKVFMAYNKTHLYIAFKCYERRMNKLKTIWNHPEERDNSIYSDDCVEVFLSPYAHQEFYHIIVNSAGVIYDSRNREKHTNILWDCNLKTAASKEENFWSVEIAIPLAEFGYFPKGGEVWQGNLCRSETPDKELSSLFPNKGKFCNYNTFGKLYFSSITDNKNSVICFADNNKINLKLNNKSNKQQVFKAILSCYQKHRKFYYLNKKIVIPASSNKYSSLTYSNKLGNQKLKLILLDLSSNKIAYSNTFSFSREKIKKGINPRVWNVDNPLYEELFSNKPAGLIKEGGYAWFHGFSRKKMIPFALQYGLPYDYRDMYKMYSEKKLHLLGRQGKLTWPYYDLLNNSRKTGIKGVLLADCRGAQAPKYKKYPFLPDPVVTKHYLKVVEKTLAERSNVIWAVAAEDEQYEHQEQVGIELFKSNKKNYPYIVKADKEIKEKYGAGIYGIPLSSEDRNPYRWIAYRRWLNEKLGKVMTELYNTVKKSYPKIQVISCDPISFAYPYDFSSWKSNCDIITHQLYPRKNSNRAVFGFITKLVRDISGVKEIWPCMHVEHYAASFSPEEVLELASQVFRNGGNGFHYYLVDTIARRKKKNYTHIECFGAPDRWQIETALIKEAGNINKLKFPKADFAILYASDSHSTHSMRFCQPEFGTEVEAAYTFAGPISGGWFDFIDDNQIARGKKLTHYKVIYIPLGNYMRREVIKKLEDYVLKGGTIVTGDPEIFSSDEHGGKTSSYRNKIFGVKLKEKSQQSEIKYNDKTLSVCGNAYNIKLLSNSKVIARFTDGKPAIIEHGYGKGKTIYFTFNPFSIKNICDNDWKNFFKQMQESFNLNLNQKIWRFKFPDRLIKRRTVPKEKCLTNNHIFWSANKPLSICNIDSHGTYSYSFKPDKIKDNGGWENISFAIGDLTDRRKAPQAGNVDLGIGNIEDWVSGWNTNKNMEITFNLLKSYQLSSLEIFHKGTIPTLEVMGSTDGKKWNRIYHSAEPVEAKDAVKKTIINLKSMKKQFLKLKFGKHINNSLVLSEIEIWRK